MRSTDLVLVCSAVVAPSLFAASGCAVAGDELLGAIVIPRDTSELDDAGEGEWVGAAADSGGDAGLDANLADSATKEADGSVDATGIDAQADATGIEAEPDADAADAESGDVVLDAGETGTPRHCAGGLYAGTFEGQLRATFGRFVFELPAVTGEVVLFLSVSDEGTKLLVDSGIVSAIDSEGDSVYARISGFVDCETGVLEDGRLTSGVYRLESLDQTFAFEGSVAGTYEHGATPRVAGTWSVGGRIESGEGTFEVHLK